MLISVLFEHRGRSSSSAGARLSGWLSGGSANLSVAIVFACTVLLASGASAQTPAPETGPDARKTDLTLTGCLERGTEGDEAGKLVFHNRAGDRQAGTQTGAATTTVRRYLVEPGEGVELGEHVGHRVRITGSIRVDNEPDRRSNAGVTPSLPSGGTGMETIPRPTDEPRDKQEAETLPATDPGSSTLVVTDVETLAATCPQEGR